jgi:hypothetical protein
MPVVEIKIKKNGKIEADFQGFPNNSCDQAEDEIFEKLKNLKMKTLIEDRKDDELLQEDLQYDH